MLNKLFAREILETCLTLGILHAVNDGVAIYHAASETDPEHYPAGWYVDDKEDIVSAIATDPEAIRELNRIWSKPDTRLRSVRRSGKILIKIFFLTKANK